MRLRCQSALPPPPSTQGCEDEGCSLAFSGPWFPFRAMGIAPVHFQAGNRSLLLPRGCCGWGSLGHPPHKADLEGLQLGCPRWPLWAASALLCPRPAPQTAWDRLLPDGQACSLLPYVTGLCKGSWPAYIRGGRASPIWGGGGS